MQIESIIAELLMRHNCVVIPKFGGFIASQKAAQIDFSKGLISSPSKAILFNKQLVNNDGLLINYIGTKNKISFNQASDLLGEKIDFWHQELNEGRRISFENLGFLFLDSERNICFEQDRFFNLLMESFGMGQVSFQTENVIEKETSELKNKSIQVEKNPEIETPTIELFPNILKVKETKQIQVDATSEEKTSNDKKIIVLAERNIKSTKKIIKYIAVAACVLPIAFYSVWIPVKTDVLESGMISFKDFNPFLKTEIPRYEKKNLNTKFNRIPKINSFDEEINKIPTKVLIYPMEIDDEVFYVKLKEKLSLSVVENSQANSEKTEKATQNFPKSSKLSNLTEGKFQIIVGSFSNQNNAEQLANELRSKGFSAYTFEQENGLIRVSAGRLKSNEEALNVVKELSNIQIDSWISK